MEYSTWGFGAESSTESSSLFGLMMELPSLFVLAEEQSSILALVEGSFSICLIEESSWMLDSFVSQSLICDFVDESMIFSAFMEQPLSMFFCNAEPSSTFNKAAEQFFLCSGMKRAQTTPYFLVLGPGPTRLPIVTLLVKAHYPIYKGS